MTPVDVVIVSYRSRSALRGCVEPLVGHEGISVTVVDNASDDGGLETIADLPVTLLEMDRNLGFAAGCNAGWSRGSAPYVLFLNPDARIDPASVRHLGSVLDEEPSVGIVAPLIRSDGGHLEYSLRRFPRLRSTYGQALFLHRALPRAQWTDELVRDEDAYTHPRSAEWVSGACLLIRRGLLEDLIGWDERFFLYSEDTDLCARARLAGFEVRFDPAATAVHTGGASSPRAELLPRLASSRFLYARKHYGPVRAFLHGLGIALGALTRSLVSPSSNARRGHRSAAQAVISLLLARDGREPA